MDTKVICGIFTLVCFCVLQGCHIASATDCPDDWVAYHGSCYLFVHGKRANFVTAENYCVQHGGHLVKIDTQRENEFVKSYLDGLQHDWFWMGLTDETIEGLWQFYGTDIDAPVLDWAPGQPNSDGDCVVYDPGNGYHWHDALCTNSASPLCEKKGATIGTEVVG